MKQRYLKIPVPKKCYNPIGMNCRLLFRTSRGYICPFRASFIVDKKDIIKLRPVKKCREAEIK